MRPTLRGVLLVGAGGSLGTAARYLAGELFPGVDPAVTLFAVNLLGSFLLGALSADLTSSRFSERSQARWHLFLRVGLLGGFTSYSALVVVSVHFLKQGTTLTMFVYGIGMLLLGCVSSFIGLKFREHCR